MFVFTNYIYDWYCNSSEHYLLNVSLSTFFHSWKGKKSSVKTLIKIRSCINYEKKIIYAKRREKCRIEMMTLLLIKL